MLLEDKKWMVILEMLWLAHHNPENRLENRKGEDDEVPRGMWKAVETGAREVGVGKAKGRRSKERSQEEERGEG